VVVFILARQTVSRDGLAGGRVHSRKSALLADDVVSRVISPVAGRARLGHRVPDRKTALGH